MHTCISTHGSQKTTPGSFLNCSNRLSLYPGAGLVGQAGHPVNSKNQPVSSFSVLQWENGLHTQLPVASRDQMQNLVLA